MYRTVQKSIPRGFVLAAFVSLMVILHTVSTQAQWATNGNNINNTNAGNVGIGTSAPLHKLGVSGNMTIGSGYTSVTSVPVDGLVAQGNVGISTAAPTMALHVIGDVTVTGNISAKYQDVAEWVPSTQKLSAGTVVILDIGHDNHVAASSTPYDTRVAGVVSAQPGIALGEAGEGEALVATTGRVKVKVEATRAPIRVGELLVTSDTPRFRRRADSPCSFPRWHLSPQRHRA